jgi:hypothetical protein
MEQNNNVEQFIWFAWMARCEAIASTVLNVSRYSKAEPGASIGFYRGFVARRRGEILCR